MLSHIGKQIDINKINTEKNEEENDNKKQNTALDDSFNNSADEESDYDSQLSSERILLVKDGEPISKRHMNEFLQDFYDEYHYHRPVHEKFIDKVYKYIDKNKES